jgi:hypothetical protein
MRSMASPEVLIVALLPDLSDGFLYRCGRKWLAAVKDPDAMLLSELSPSAPRPKHDAIVDALEFQFVARRQLQAIPHQLG